MLKNSFATYIERGAAIGYIPVSQLEPIAKRLVSPTLFAQLRGHLNPLAVRAAGAAMFRRRLSYSKLIATNPTAETLLAEAKKFSSETRRSLYQNAANRLSDAGQYERALALLNDNSRMMTLDSAISGLNWYQAHLLIQRGELRRAEAMMMQFNDSNRISGLVSLATGSL